MNIKLILKGFLVGIGKIIPGVSGSMLAISMGIYEDIILAITDFFSDPKKKGYLLFNFGLGVFLAIIFFSRVLLFLLNNYYDKVMYLFLGLIGGTLIPFVKSLKVSFKNGVIFLGILLLMLVIFFNDMGMVYVFKGSIKDYFYTLFLGGVDSFSSIIPGVSGTAIYITLGCYNYVISLLSNPFSLGFIMYIIGVIGGVIFTCYLVNYLFKNWKEEGLWAMFALMISSILFLFLNILGYFKVSNGIILIMGLVLGYIFC